MVIFFLWLMRNAVAIPEFHDRVRLLQPERVPPSSRLHHSEVCFNALQELARQDAAAALGVLHIRIGKAFCREQSFRKSILSLSFHLFTFRGTTTTEREQAVAHKKT